MRIFRPGDAPVWVDAVLRSIERGLRLPFDAPVRLQEFTVATLPAPSEWRGGLIHVTNEVGGAQPAFSDGTNWRRVTDRAIVT